MIINNPMLPPLQGYVEDINENGNPIYVKTHGQIQKEIYTSQIQTLLSDPNVIVRIAALEAAMTSQMGV